MRLHSSATYADMASSAPFTGEDWPASISGLILLAITAEFTEIAQFVIGEMVMINTLTLRSLRGSALSVARNRGITGTPTK